MKKIKLNTAKLQLNKEKISELSNVDHLKVDEMKQINGGEQEDFLSSVLPV